MFTLKYTRKEQDASCGGKKISTGNKGKYMAVNAIAIIGQLRKENAKTLIEIFLTIIQINNFNILIKLLAFYSSFNVIEKY